MVIAFVGSVIVFNAVHPKKAEAPIEVILVPLIVTEFRVVLALNIDGGIIVPDAPPIIVTPVEIPANALFPIMLVLSDVGMVIEVNDEHPEKAPAPIDVTFVPINN